MHLSSHTNKVYQKRTVEIFFWEGGGVGGGGLGKQGSRRKQDGLYTCAIGDRVQQGYSLPDSDDLTVMLKYFW